MKRNRLFFFPDNAAPGSSGSSAVAELIAPAGSVDISSYEPPSIDDLDAELLRGGDLPNPSLAELPTPEPPPAKTPVKAAPAKPEPAKPAAKSGEKPVEAAKPVVDQRKPEELPINELRTAYKTLKEQSELQRTELESLKTDHPEVKVLRGELEEAKKRLETLQKAGDDYERKLAFFSPAAAAKIGELNSSFNAEINPLVEDIPGLIDEYGQLVRQYNSLPRGREQKQEFKEKLEALEQHISDNYGERKADRVMQVIQRGARHLQEVSKLEKDLREDGGKFLFDQQVQDWSKASQKFEEDSKGFLEIDPDVAASDPYHPINILRHSQKEDPERFAELEGKVREFARRISLGPKPKQKSDFAGMDEDQISEALISQAKQAASDKALAAKLIVQGSLSMAYMRPFFAEFKKMEERLKELGAPDPGARSSTPPPARAGDLSSVDPSTYEPPEIPSEHEFAMG